MGHYLLKFLQKHQWQNDLLDGKIYMNTLGYFKTYDKSDKTRSDKHEAIHSYVKPQLIKMGNMTFSENELSMMTLNSCEYDYCNIYSMYALWKKDEDDIVYIDEKNKEFGSYCVCIHNPKEFLLRIEKLIESSFILNYSKIEYIPVNTFANTYIKEEMIPFTKFDSYEYQNEFRIIINRQIIENKAYVLEIGNIRDIATVISIDDINSQLLKQTKKQ